MIVKSIVLFCDHAADGSAEIAIERETVNTIRSAYPASVIDIVRPAAEISPNVGIAKRQPRDEDTVRRIAVPRADSDALDYAADPASWLSDCTVADVDLVVVAPAKRFFSRAGDENFRDLFWLALPVFAARHAGKHCLILPSGFGPFETDEAKALVAQMLETKPRIVTGDIRSAEMLKAFDPSVEVSAQLDPAAFSDTPHAGLAGPALSSSKPLLKLAAMVVASAREPDIDGAVSGALGFELNLETAREQIRKGEIELRKSSARAYGLEQELEKAMERIRKSEVELRKVSAKAYLLRGNGGAAIQARRIGALERRVESIENSGSYRVGRALSEARKSPGKLLQLPLELWSIGGEIRGRRAALEERASRSLTEDLKKELLALFDEGGVAAVIERVEALFPADRTARAATLVAASTLFAERNMQDAELALVRKAARTRGSESTLLTLFRLAQRSNDLLATAQAIRGLQRLYSGSEPTPAQKAILEEGRRSPAHQLLLLDMVPENAESPVGSVQGRICYILHNSLPYSSGGYAARAQGLASGLKTAGFDVVVLTRPGFPLDSMSDLTATGVPLEETIDGIVHRRILQPLRRESSVAEYIEAAARELTTALADVKPAAVIAASNYQTALPALIAARRLGLPFFYEIRGLWEITRISREPAFAERPEYRLHELMEAGTAMLSDHVFTLTGPMKQEMVRRGVASRDITLLPNSCAPERFTPRPRDEALAEKFGIPAGVPVIGYIGTFAQYEGLDLLVEAAAVLRKRGHVFRLLIVGNENVSGQSLGPVTTEIRTVARERGLEDWLLMPGRVPHEEVAAYYSLIDIAPFPRKAQPVTEMVSPMKPLEAYAMEKAVIASSVEALAEMVDHGRTGLVFEKDNLESLIDALERLIANPDLRGELGAAARRWVEAERTWDATARVAAEIINQVSLRPLGERRRRLMLDSTTFKPEDEAYDEDDSTSRRKLDSRQLARRQRASSRVKLLRQLDKHARQETVSPEIKTRGLLYLLHNCLPYHSGGYAIRAHGLLKGFQEAGWQVTAQARPGYPLDRAKSVEAVPASRLVDGVEYRFLDEPISIDDADQVNYVEQYAESVLRAVDPSRIGLVQATSFFQSGLAGRLIADRLGVPLVYEMRGMEWLTNGSRDPAWQKSMPGIIGRDLELRAARQADHVFAITGALKTWLVDHGIPESRVSILPNGCTVEDAVVDTGGRDRLAKQLDIEGAFVVGYVGSVVYYEGIDVIIKAVGEARERSGLDIRFVLVGDGPEFANVRHYAGESGSEPFVEFIGRVPHHELSDYYALIDAFVLSRTDLEICHIISPLKPLEALMKGKLLITSDVEAIREMVDASQGGALMFKAGDSSQLAQRILEAAKDPARMAEIAKRGREWAVNKRNWSHLAREALETLEAKFGTPGHR